MIILGLGDLFLDLISKALYALVQGFFTILYWLERVFKILAGAEPIPGGGNGTDSYSILDVVLKDTITAKLLGIFLFLGLAFFVLSLSVGLVKANMKKDSPGESKKVLASSFKALFYFIFIPTLFMLATYFTGQIIYHVVGSISSSITGQSISQTTSVSDSIANTLFTRLFNKNDRAHIQGLTFQSSYDAFAENGISMRMDKTSFQYVIAIVVSAIMFWTLGISTIGLAERIINIVILYLISPVMIGTSPLDSGSRLNVWKDKVVSKLFGVMGNILSMYVFLLVLGVVGDIIDYAGKNVQGEDQWILTCVYGVVCIAGAMMCCKGGTLISSLISAQQGQEEGLSSMATSQLAGQGMKLAGAGLALAGGGALAMAKGMASKGLGATSKSISGAAGALGGGKSALSANSTGSSSPNTGSSATPGSTPNALQKGIGATSKIPLIGGALSTLGGLAYGAGRLAGKGIKAAGNAALHPINTAKSVGNTAKTAGSKIKQAATAPGRAIQSGMKSLYQNVSKRAQSGLGHISTKSMGALGKDKEVKAATKSLNQANKSLYKAQRSQEKADKDFQKINHKLQNSNGNSDIKLNHKYFQSLKRLEKQNDDLAKKTTAQQNADTNLLATQKDAGRRQSNSKLKKIGDAEK